VVELSKVSLASSSRPARARASTYQNVHSENVPSLPASDGHEIVDLAHPVRREEPGDQDRRFRDVELLGHVIVAVRTDPEVAAVVRVEQ
jgi:hypothetical protein